MTAEVAPDPTVLPDALPPDVPPKVDRRGRPTTRAGRRAAGEGTRAKADRKPRTAAGPKRPTFEQTRQALTETLAIPALLLSAKCQPCGLHVGAHAGELADAWIEVARVDDRVRRALEAITTSSALVTAITTTVGVALPVLAYHTPLPIPRALVAGVDHTPALHVEPEPAAA